MKAKFIKDVSKDFRGEAKVFEMEPPLEGEQHVVVSAVVVPYSGPETYIFGYDLTEGRVTNYGELEGSFRGGLNIGEALRNAGYEVIQ